MVTLSLRTIREIKEVAYRPEEVTLEDEDLAYLVVRNPGSNLTIFPPYRLGTEYPKTYGHFHVPPYEEHYRVLYGKAGFLLQKMEGEQVVSIQFKVVEAGQSFAVPIGWGHVTINLGEDYLITQDDHDPAHFENDYTLVKKLGGFGFFVVEEGGDWKAVPNPRYSNPPSWETI